MPRLTKDRAHVRVNRAGRLRDHVRNMNPQPGDQLLVGMVEGHAGQSLRRAGWKIRTEITDRKVQRDDGKIVPVTLVKFL